MNLPEVVIKQTPAIIQCNFDEIKEALATQMEAYKDLPVTEDNEQERKKDLATLRKIRKAVDDKRKDIKKEAETPIKAFEAEVKDVLAVIDKPIAEIDGQLKDLDQKRIQERQAHLLDVYNENIGEWAEYLPFNMIKKPQWDNRTCTDKDIIFDISELKVKVENDVNAIKATGSEIEDRMLAVYKQSGDLAAAIRRHTEYMEAKKAAEEHAKKEAEARIAQAEAEAQRKAEEEIRKAEERIRDEVKAAPTACQPAHPVDVWGRTLTIRVHGEEDCEAVLEFLQAAKIEYQEV